MMKDDSAERLTPLSTSVPTSVAEAYRRAATALDKSLSQLIREVLEDGVRGVLTRVEVTERLAAGEPQTAAAAYYGLAHHQEEEALDGMVQAILLLMDAQSATLEDRHLT
jgi:hypothetical protein